MNEKDQGKPKKGPRTNRDNQETEGNLKKKIHSFKISHS